RPRRKRPCCRCAAEQRDEVAPPHGASPPADSGRAEAITFGRRLLCATTNLAGDVSVGSQAVKLITSKCFPVCPRKRTYLPISELLPPPAIGQRRHRGLARRLITVSRQMGRSAQRDFTIAVLTRAKYFLPLIV